MTQEFKVLKIRGVNRVGLNMLPKVWQEGLSEGVPLNIIIQLLDVI